MSILDALRGRIVDLDSHIMLTPDQLHALMGEELMVPGKMGRVMAGIAGASPEMKVRREQRMQEARALPMTPESCYDLKGAGVYGALDVGERLDVMDMMGIRCQIQFPTGMWPAQWWDDASCHDAVARYNDFVLDWGRRDPQRLCPAALLNTSDVDRAVAEARRVVDVGARAVMVTCIRPPAGISPAHPRWNALWEILDTAGATVFMHVGANGLGVAGQNFLDVEWGAVDGRALGPFGTVVRSFGPETYFTAMIFGGVFERYPRIRYGVIELAARWVGPWVDRMDAVAARTALPLKPSEYVVRQMRVTPFYGEPVGLFIERYGLEDVYAFSTDFPHAEGGRRPVERFHESLAGCGDGVIEKFFVRNAELLLPRAA